MYVSTVAISYPKCVYGMLVCMVSLYVNGVFVSEWCFPVTVLHGICCTTHTSIVTDVNSTVAISQKKKQHTGYQFAIINKSLT